MGGCFSRAIVNGGDILARGLPPVPSWILLCVAGEQVQPRQDAPSSGFYQCFGCKMPLQEEQQRGPELEQPGPSFGKATGCLGT